MACDRCNLYFSLWAIFCSKKYLRNSLKNQNKKNTWKYHYFTHNQKLWSDDVRFLRYGVRRTDGRTEKVTNRGRCPT